MKNKLLRNEDDPAPNQMLDPVALPDFDDVGEKPKCNCAGMFHDDNCQLRVN